MPLLPPHSPCNVRSCHSFQYCCSLMTFTFLLRLTHSCRNISAWIVTVFALLGLQWYVGCATGFLWALAHCSSVTRGRKYPWEATWGGRRECLNSTKERCCLHVVELLWAPRVACPFQFAKLPVGHSRAEELFTLAILGVNSKIVNSKKTYLRFVKVSMFSNSSEKTMRTFSVSMSL